MSSIFLSHNSQDKPFARRLAEDLAARGVRVWFDKAEIRVGESLLEKIAEGIHEMEYLGVVLSPSSAKAPWVEFELQIAMTLEVSSRKLRVLPIYYQECEYPRFLVHKRYVDFRDPGRYRQAFADLLQTLEPEPPLQRMTGKEAARLVKTTQRPRGDLFGLSQQGITQQYISWLVRDSRDWLAADAKTGRSTAWVVDFYDAGENTMIPFGVYDGTIVDFPTLRMEGDEPRVFDTAYVDSDLAVPAAISFAKRENRLPPDEDYFVNTRLCWYGPLGFVWLIMFMDVTLRRTFHHVYVDAITGTVVPDPPG